MNPKASELLNKISKLFSAENASALEKDLLKQYLRELYEMVDDVEVTAKIEEMKVEPVKKIIPVTEDIVEEKNELVIAKHEDVKVAKPKVSINEKVKPSESLNEKVKPGATEIHKQLSLKPLRELIDMNKRFALVNELFKGDSESFAIAVAQIDSMSDFTSAESFLEEISGRNNWNATSQTAKLFSKLVKQKFGMH